MTVTTLISVVEFTGESFATSTFTFCFIGIHFQVEKEIR